MQLAAARLFRSRAPGLRSRMGGQQSMARRADLGKSMDRHGSSGLR